jgi:hypothetical protein
MRRRALLASVGTGTAGIAGCLTLFRAACDSAGPRRVELAGTADVPSDPGLSMTATMERERVTDDRTARLRVGVANDGADRETWVADEQYCHLFNRRQGRSDPSGLWLHRNRDAPTDRAGDCWSRELSRRDPVFDDVDCPRRLLESGASVETTYQVWADHTTAGYMAPGTYRFEVRIDLWAAESTADWPDETVDWWLDLEVSEA